MLLEIDFIEETKTTWDNKEVLQNFFHYFTYSRKYGLIRFTLHPWQPWISRFCDVTKGRFRKNSRKLRNAMFDEEVIA